MPEDGSLLQLMLFVAFGAGLITFGSNVLFILASNLEAPTFKYAMSHIIDVALLIYSNFGNVWKLFKILLESLHVNCYKASALNPQGEGIPKGLFWLMLK